MKTCRYCLETKPSVEFPKTGAKCKACKHEYYLANKERILQRRKKYYYANREACLAANKRYRQENRDKVREMQRRWNQDNRDKIRESIRKWKAANQARQHWMVNDWESRQRADASGGDTIRFSFAEFKARMAYYGGCCWLCRDVATEVDHVKPISKGGAHMLANIRPICGPCNRSKAAKWPLRGLLAA